MTTLAVDYQGQQAISLCSKFLTAGLENDWTWSFARTPVSIPKKIFASLLIRSYSSVRIKFKPTPEVYSFEINTRVRYERGNNELHVTKDKPETPPALSEYLEKVDSAKQDVLLNLFKSYEKKNIFSFEEDGIPYFVYGQSPFMFEKVMIDDMRLLDAPKVVARDVHGIKNKISLHLHVKRTPPVDKKAPKAIVNFFRRINQMYPEKNFIFPSDKDLLLGLAYPLQGIILVSRNEFAKFVLKMEPTEQDLIYRSYEQNGATQEGLFVSVKKTHELAKEYVTKIMENLDSYFKERGCPILIWETKRGKPIESVFFTEYKIV